MEFGSNFVIFSVASGSRLDRADRVGHHARVAVHRTRRPVALADLVEHGPADADAGIGLEAGALAGVVFLRGLEQADHAGLHQVLHLHAGRQAAEQVIGDALDQWCVTLDQLLLGVLRLRLAIHTHSRGRCHTAEPVAGCWTSRSTKNSRCPRGLAGSGQLSTFCATALKARDAFERGNASYTARCFCTALRTDSS